MLWVPDCIVSAGRGQGSVEAWCTLALDIAESLSRVGDDHVHLIVADVVKSFDIVDGNFVDKVLSILGVPDWCGHAYFELHAQFRLWF